MKFLWSLLLYTALGLGANTAFAIDASQFDALKTGDMRKLAWAKSDAMVSSVTYFDDAGQGTNLLTYRGKTVVLKMKADRLSSLTRNVSLPDPTQLADVMFDKGRSMMRQVLKEHPGEMSF